MTDIFFILNLDKFPSFQPQPICLIFSDQDTKLFVSRRNEILGLSEEGRKTKLVFTGSLLHTYNFLRVSHNFSCSIFKFSSVMDDPKGII